MGHTQDRLVIEAKAPDIRGAAGLLGALHQWLPTAKRPSPQEGLRTYRRPRWRGPLLASLLLLPTLASGAYLAFVATDRYVSEARFVVRTASKPAGSGGFGAIFQLVGISRADDDVFSVQDFLSSRDAIEKLGQKLPLKDIYSRPGVDFLMRYPSLIYGGTHEEFYKYIKTLVDVAYNATTGITTLDVQAFQPEDAHKVASALLDLAEEKVNELNGRLREDAIKVASDEVARSEARLTEAMVKITTFQNRELMIDPAKNSAMLGELIGRLGADLADTQFKATEKAGGAPSDPGLSVLNQRATALQSQIQHEREQIAGDSSGLADKLAVYERLAMERDFAKQALNRSLETLDAARTEARRQQLFLERVVSPSEPDYPTMPARASAFATILTLNLIALMVFWLFRTGLQEHAQADS
jgi:capsular polysaccharide transport system permease protein